TCPIGHASRSVIDFPLVQDLESLLWIINLGCIDLNPWYATCDDVHRPDYLHFDLDPTPGAKFQHVLETALLVRGALDELEIRSYAKTTGSRGIHIYVPIVRGPKQKEVWKFVKALAEAMEARHPNIITAEYRVATRPPACTLVCRMYRAIRRVLRGRLFAHKCVMAHVPMTVCRHTSTRSISAVR